MRSCLIILVSCFMSWQVLAEPVPVLESEGSPVTTLLPAELDVNPYALEDVQEYIAWFFQYSNPTKLDKALQYAPLVVEIAHEYGIDPIFIAVIISCESSWKATSNGAIGEYGLMQTHGVASQGFDTSTPEGQVRAGTNYLMDSWVKCGSTQRALTRYQTGSCRSSAGAADWRYRKWQEARDRLGLSYLESPFL